MPNVQVGILHSLSGTMAISEASLIDAELMAIAEINQTGGVLGRLIEPLIEDGASSPVCFEGKARKLLVGDGVNTVFGGWTSASRKAVKPVFEELNALLWYPVQYEGLECSPNIFYTGCCPNQQVEPAVTWLLQNHRTRFFLLGSDYVFPRTANKLIKAQLKQSGCQEQEAIVVGEEYVPLGVQDFEKVITKIRQAQPDVIFNTLNGDSNLAFYRQCQDAGINASELPIMAVSVAEAELERMGDAAVGHYACWTYFQSLNTVNNKIFVKNFQQRYGLNRVTSDPIEAAYTQVYLWKQSVEKAQSFAVDKVRIAAYNQTFEAPGGLVRIEHHNLWKQCKVGQILANGQFKIVFNDDNLIKPLPWLGVEELEFSRLAVVIDMLAEIPQEIQYSWKLEQKSRELEAASAQLQTEIAERKQTEKVLQQAKEAAEVANRAKSEFLSKMSHELRTPLNAILGFTQVLTRDKSINSEQQEQLEIINRSGEHLLNLINDVLEMSKIESGRISLRETSFDLYRMLDSLKEMLQLKAESKGLQFNFECDSDVPQYVQADQGKLRQILINILGNAIKFTQEGSINLQVSLLKNQEELINNIEITTAHILEQKIIQFEITDTGFGIAPEEMDKLFEAFVQTESGQKSQEGTGLGLPISQQFVQLMQGKIKVTSGLGKGTIFKVELPIKLAPSDEIETQKPQQRVIGLQPDQPTYRILIVEDHWENRQLLIKLLAPLRFEVREAENGKVGVELWQSWEPHLIWMDMRMPVMDGYEATKRIKAELQGQATVIIALTASALEEEKEIVLSAGCDDFMRKPFQASVLFEKLAKHLGVRYVYEKANLNLLHSETEAGINFDSLDVMSDQWVAQLTQAATEAHGSLIFQLIKQIPEQNASLASKLTELVNNFRFDKIIDLTQNIAHDKQSN